MSETSSKNKKKTLTGKDKNVINVNPELKETVIFSWARMNPPTRGHERLVAEMETFDGDKIIHLSHSELTKRNPLSYAEKLKYAQIAFGDIIQESASRNIVESLKQLSQEYRNIILVVGEDRVEEFTEMFEKYSDRDFKFENWQIASAGARDVESGDIEGISASILREACITNDYSTILWALPESLIDYAEEIQNKVIEAYGISEALSVVQRVKRAQIMKRHKAILKVARRRAMQRRANKKVLNKRARRDAISFMKTKLSGGQKASDLSYAQKARVEDLIKKRKGAVARLAKRLVNKEREKESDRFSKK